MNNSEIQSILQTVIPELPEAKAQKKATIPNTSDLAKNPLKGNRLNSGRLRSQFIVFENSQLWETSEETSRKSLHSDQRVFVQKGDDVWDIYSGKTLTDENVEPILIKENTKGLAELLRSEKEKIGTQRQYSHEVPSPHQLITYGAPGTGKSHTVKRETEGQNAFRTTFHPDSDYASFVGAYKPIMKKIERTALVGKKLEMADVESVKDELKMDSVISYEFVEQVFTKAYVLAWEYQKAAKAGETAKPVYLVIEEINRGNCAQIFGDLFQLLDRNESDFSEYPITPDSDFGKHIKERLEAATATFDAYRKAHINALYKEADVVDKALAGQLLLLPDNLFLRATMNTSDQSLFPMDSAFKRRWDWKYIPIRDAGKGWKIVADGSEFQWGDFIKTVNKSILDTLKSEDKQLGYFFVHPDDDRSDTIAASKFVNKVLFYLYNDVFRDYDLPKGFAKQGGGMFEFQEFFKDDGETNEAVVKALLTGLLPQQQ